ncbi:MAG: ferredoxin [Chromatiales bacterium]
MTSTRKHDMGSGGECICPKCGTKVPHQQGVPCQQMHCPECGAKMLREGSYHHELLQKKHDKQPPE